MVGDDEAEDDIVRRAVVPAGARFAKPPPVGLAARMVLQRGDGPIQYPLRCEILVEVRVLVGSCLRPIVFVNAAAHLEEHAQGDVVDFGAVNTRSKPNEGPYEKGMQKYRVYAAQYYFQFEKSAQNYF